MPNSPYNIAILQQQLNQLDHFCYVTSGGQKAVFDTTHVTYGRVALKILSPNCNLERMQREIQSVKTINNGKVPMVFEVGELSDPYQGHPWLIEQWVEGSSLRELINKGNISNKLILQLASDMLTTLVEAERNKIVHRDIKPENIIVSPDGACCWLVDFGIARHLDRTSITVDMMPHTLGYAPIEQLLGLRADIDTRSDLFSLGVTLYECIEGLNPYTHGAKDIDEVIKRVANTKLPLVARKVDNIDDLKNLIESMTMPKRIHRIASASEAHQWISEIVQAGEV